MSEDAKKEWMCSECRTITLEPDLLRAENPFDADDIIVGCPECRSINSFTEVCDEPGCVDIATCGFHVREGFGRYRRVCGQHYFKLKQS